MDRIIGIEHGTSEQSALRGAETKAAVGIEEFGRRVEKLSPAERRKFTNLLDALGENLLERSQSLHPEGSQTKALEGITLALTAANLFLAPNPDYVAGAEVIHGLLTGGYEGQMRAVFSSAAIPPREILPKK